MKRIIYVLSIFMLITSAFGTEKNVCIVNKITCTGCDTNPTVVEEIKDALTKRNYIIDESDQAGQEVIIEYSQQKEIPENSIMQVCLYQQESLEPGVWSILKIITGNDWIRTCEYSEKEEEERLSYKAGGAKFHSLSIETSAHSDGFFTAKKVDEHNSSRTFNKMLRSMDLKDCM